MIQIHVRSVYNRLPEIRAKLPREAGAVVHSIGDEMVAAIRSGINNRTGYLSSTVSARATGAMNLIVAATAYYAPYVEFGTRRNRAYPFFYPGVDRVRPVFIERMVAMLGGL